LKDITNMLPTKVCHGFFGQRGNVGPVNVDGAVRGSIKPSHEA